MKILLVIYDSYGNGGASISSYELALALQKIGFKIFIVSLKQYPRFKTFIIKNVRYIPLFFLRDLYVSFVLSRIIKKEKIDIVHSSECRFTSVGTIKAAQKNKIKSVIHYRSYWFCCLKGDLLFKNKYLCQGLNYKKCKHCNLKFKMTWQLYKYFYFKKKLKLLKKADAHIGISDTVRERLGKYGINKNVYTINNPVFIKKEKKINISEASIVNHKKSIVVGFLGKLIYHRGIKNFLEIAKIVAQKEKRIFFQIAGSGPMEKDCKEFIKVNALSNIKLLGQINHDKVKEFYKNCDILFFPSILPEPFGRVIIEAMSSGTIVVASKLGAAVEIIKNSKNGFLVNPHNYQECVDLLIDLYLNLNKFYVLKQAARDRAKDFLPEYSAKKVAKVYNSII